MKPVRLKVNINPKCQAEFEAGSPKEAIEILASYSEVFAESVCKNCGKDKIHFSHRVIDGNAFFGLSCDSCGAQFDFGQKKDQVNLFPKREKGTQGWYIYQRGDQQ